MGTELDCMESSASKAFLNSRPHCPCLLISLALPKLRVSITLWTSFRRTDFSNL